MRESAFVKELTTEVGMKYPLAFNIFQLSTINFQLKFVPLQRIKG